MPEPTEFLPTEKHCSCCKQLLPLSDFHHSSTTRDKHQNLCKVCRRQFDIKRRAIEHGYARPTYEPYGGARYGCRGVDSNNGWTKMCTLCKTYKPLDEFYNYKRKSDGLSSECKGCRLALYHRKYKFNRDRSRRCSTE